LLLCGAPHKSKRIAHFTLDIVAEDDRVLQADGGADQPAQRRALVVGLALLHGESRGDPNAFESVLTFAPDGAATRIEMLTVFPTKELRDEVVEKYHAIEGGQQTLSKLAAYVTEIIQKGVED
jgi:hypothetical protein